MVYLISVSVYMYVDPVMKFRYHGTYLLASLGRLYMYHYCKGIHVAVPHYLFSS